MCEITCYFWMLLEYKHSLVAVLGYHLLNVPLGLVESTETLVDDSE